MYSSSEPKAYKAEGIGIDVISEVFDKDVVDQIIPMIPDGFKNEPHGTKLNQQKLLHPLILRQPGNGKKSGNAGRNPEA